MTYSYDAHGEAEIQSNVNLDKFLYSFKTDAPQIQSRSIVINVAPVDPAPPSSVRIGMMFGYDRETDGLTFDYSWLTPLRCRVSGVNSSHTEIRLTQSYRTLSDLAGEGFDLGHLMESLLELKLLRDSLTFFHGACLEKDGVGILLPAFANTGKTRASLALTQTGKYRFLSDDTTMVGGEGKALSYACLVNLTGPSQSVSQFRPTLRERLRMTANTFATKILTNKFVQPGIFVQPERVFGDIADSTVVRRVFFLESGPERTSEIDADLALKKMRAINSREIPWAVSPYLQAYQYARDDFDIDEFADREKRVLDRFATKIESFQVISSRGGHAGLVQGLMR